MTADSLKDLGNKSFSAGNYTEAITYFTQAIELDPKNHVLYSNRSAAHASLKNYESALSDAEQVVSIKPDWAKGYSRKGAALHGLGNLSEAHKTYTKGLEIEPENALLKKGLNDVEAAEESPKNNPFASMFGPDMWSKIATNPNLSPLLAQPDIVQKLQEIQRNPSTINQYMQDPRMMQIMMGLLGLNSNMAGGDDMNVDTEPNQSHVSEEPRSTPKQPETQPEPVVVEETDPEKIKRSQSDAEKDKGNEFYKKRKFNEALTCYDKAWELDSSNFAVLTNKAAVLYEMEKYQESIEVCKECIELGQQVFADFKIIARAYGRMGNSYAKLGDLENAIKFLNKSLTEHRTPEVLKKVRELEKAKVEQDRLAYRSVELSDAARERGNELFKNHLYSDAVREYTEAIKRNDSDPKNYSNRAACYTKLLALPEADKDCDAAIKLDPKFVKAYIRKAAILFAKKDFSKCIELCTEAKAIDIEGKHTSEIDTQMSKCYGGLSQAQTGTPEEIQKNAMSNPEIQEIMADPVMQQILQQMQQDPRAAQDHMKNPMIAKKIRTLIHAGIIRTA